MQKQCHGNAMMVFKEALLQKKNLMLKNYKPEKLRITVMGGSI